MLRVQTTISMGDHYIERVLEIDDISTLTAEERAAIIDGAIPPISIDEEDTETEDTRCQDAPVNASED